MKIKFWGVRGSIPTPGFNTARYGGNTSCIEIEINDTTIILDAGTGIRELGFDLLKKGKPVNAYILISHTHWDHIQGFPFFVPIFIPTTQLKIYAPKVQDFKSLSDVMSYQMSYQMFPIRKEEIDNMNSKIEYFDIIEGPLDIPELKEKGITITAKYMNHPVICLGYKIEYNGKTIIYTGDNEPYYNLFKKKEEVKTEEPKKETSSILFDDDYDDDVDDLEAEKAVADMQQSFINFIKDADVFITDSQYTEEEYPSKKGWGHTSMEKAISFAKQANCKSVYLTHHEPLRSDDAIDKLLKKFRNQFINDINLLSINFAKEKDSIII